VTLPPSLRAAVERECASVDRARLSRAAGQITAAYKGGQFGVSLSSAESRAAYLLTRLPATYAANRFVFAEVARLAADFAPRSLLDFGAGPGTAAWAATEKWISIQQETLVEANHDMLSIGRRLAETDQRMATARWVEGNDFPKETADLVILSYVIGELKNALKIVSAAWRATKKMLVIIEPGTPKNFATLARVRSELIVLGGHIVAPCPHPNECPMDGTGDWCHFAVRLERTSEHRRLKGGVLGYEDEKFSYLAFSKEPRLRAASRIVRHPEIRSGFIKLKLCTPDGLSDQTVTRSQKDNFRAARRAKWGDEWLNWNRLSTDE
jgi:ribosomal protein RSM22 (predicted rRNA methylase)